MMTIAEAALQALVKEGVPMDVEQMVKAIEKHGLYVFNSDDKVSIVREQVRRHTKIRGKNIQYTPILFEMKNDSLYRPCDLGGNNSVGSFRRVRRPKDKEYVIEKLTGKGDSRFGEIWRLMIFAACVGIKAKRKEPVTDYDSGKSIDFSYFSGAAAWPGFIHLLGLVEEEDPRILNPDQERMDRRIEIFEAYVNGGLAEMSDAMESRDFSLDSLLTLFPRAQKPATIADEVGVI
jgi:dnd system-associated protein 4